MYRLPPVLRTSLAFALTGALAGCPDQDRIDRLVDAIEVSDTAEVGGGDALVDATADTTRPEVDGEVGPTDTNAADGVNDTGGDTLAPADTNEPADVSFDTSYDTTAPPWTVDPDADWALGRPLPVGSSDGASTSVGPPLRADGVTYVPVRVGGGSLVADRRPFAAPDVGAHAAVLRLAGDLEAPRVANAAYLDGALSQPELPRIARCGEHLYATVNEAGGQAARLVQLSLDFELVSVATFAASTGLGNSVKLGAPLCGGPGFVVTLDAVGGALFTAPNAKMSQFDAGQTDGRTLIVNGTKVFAENAAQTISANSMRIVHMARGADKKVFYVGEATVQRQIGETTLLPGDQLVYQHDFATSTGGSIANQGFFGRDDILGITGAADGRFVVLWTDVTAPARGGDPELVEAAVTLFDATGDRVWSKRSSGWTPERVAFAGADVRVAGRFRSLEVLGLATVPNGPEDAFLAVLAGADGARLRHVTAGVVGQATGIAGPIFDAVGAGDCAAGALDAIMTRAGGARTLVGVGAGGSRCASEPVAAGGAELLFTTTVEGDAVDFWLGASALPEGLAVGTGAWPASGAVVGPARGRLVNPL